MSWRQFVDRLADPGEIREQVEGAFEAGVIGFGLIPKVTAVNS